MKVFGLLIFNSCVGSEAHPTINGYRLPPEPLNNSTLFIIINLSSIMQTI
ncbi:MAG: hypothetical protein MUP09_04585 [Thiovulaceae bacterium]|nr:hypothetical protein [Sulfurimonadaceae bacterium]